MWLDEVGPRPGRALCAKRESLGYLLKRTRSHWKGETFLGVGALAMRQVKPGGSPMGASSLWGGAHPFAFPSYMSDSYALDVFQNHVCGDNK